jgi:hypothetical protein
MPHGCNAGFSLITDANSTAMDKWCLINCLRSTLVNCPASKCKCSTAPPTFKVPIDAATTTKSALTGTIAYAEDLPFEVSNVARFRIEVPNWTLATRALPVTKLMHKLFVPSRC